MGNAEGCDVPRPEESADSCFPQYVKSVESDGHPTMITNVGTLVQVPTFDVLVYPARIPANAPTIASASSPISRISMFSAYWSGSMAAFTLGSKTW